MTWVLVMNGRKYFMGSVGFREKRRELTASARFLFELFYEDLMVEQTNVVIVSPGDRIEIRDHLCVTDKTITVALKQLKAGNFIRGKIPGHYMVNPEMIIRTKQENLKKLMNDYAIFSKRRSTIKENKSEYIKKVSKKMVQ